MSDVFARDIRTVVQYEDETHVHVAVAGAWRMSRNKRTGLLWTATIQRDASGHESWIVERGKPACPGRLLGNAWDWHRVIQRAWRLRFELFAPDPSLCFPSAFNKSTASSHYELAMNKILNRRAPRPDGTSSGFSFSLAKELWRALFDPETAKLALAYFGRNATFQDYNLTVRRRKELTARRTETPNLAPLLGRMIKSDVKLRTGRYTLPENLVAITRSTFFRNQHGQSLPPAAWRYLAASSSATVETVANLVGRLSNSSKSMDDIHIAMSWLAQTNVRLPHTFIVWVLRTLDHPPASASAAEHETLQRFVRLAGTAAIEAKKRKSLKEFLRRDLGLTLDWLRNSAANEEVNFNPPPTCCWFTPAPRPLANIPKNATWASIDRAQREWHAARVAREEERRLRDRIAYEREQAMRDAKTWVSAIGSTAIGATTIHPLITGKDLRIEGQVMDHCVADYIGQCEAGTSRIFRLASSSERVTVELVSTDKKKSKWRAGQVFGYGNSDATNSMRKLARRLATSYSQACASPPSPAP